MPPAMGSVIPPKEMECSFVSLTDDPDATLAYSYIQPGKESDVTTLVLFLNGLMSTQQSWLGTLCALLRKTASSESSRPALLAYDRYGQGRTVTRDPRDSDHKPGQGHDCLDAARDAHELIRAVCDKYAQPFPRKIILVGNSIGCAIARLFTNAFPGTVAGLLLLDSIMSDTDFVSLFPDPESPGFDPRTLPDGVDIELIRHTREVWQKVFHPSVPNAEGLNRSNLRSTLLPRPDAPLLQGYGGEPPLLTVVGHDPEHFARESETGSLKTPFTISMTYVNPPWQRYNEGLLELAPGNPHAVRIARGCGHFIQLDDPELVASLLESTIEQMPG